MTDRQKNWLECLLDKAQKFWPISLLLMALTLLSQLESLQVWSKGLAFVLNHWRDLIRLLWEFLVNFIRALVQLPRLKIESPIPEILTFASLFFTSIRAKRSIDHYLTTLLDKKIEGARYEHYIRGAIVFSFVALSIIAIGILLSNYYISLLIFGLMLGFGMILEYVFKKLGSSHKDFFGEVVACFWFVTGAVAILGCAVFIAAVFLELVVEYLGVVLAQFEYFQREET